MPGAVPVSSSGRWGRRRVRVTQCVAVLEAEQVYGSLIVSGRVFGPGWHDTLCWSPHGAGGPSWAIRVEVRANAVWRFGRLFLVCPHCQQRATRMYVPVVGHPPACRRCFGLSYESRTANYKATGLAADWGPVAYQTTNARRDERHQAARARYALRRPFLAASLVENASAKVLATVRQP